MAAPTPTMSIVVTPPSPAVREGGPKPALLVLSPSPAHQGISSPQSSIGPAASARASSPPLAARSPSPVPQRISSPQSSIGTAAAPQSPLAPLVRADSVSHLSMFFGDDSDTVEADQARFKKLTQETFDTHELPSGNLPPQMEAQIDFRGRDRRSMVGSASEALAALPATSKEAAAAVPTRDLRTRRLSAQAQIPSQIDRLQSIVESQAGTIQVLMEKNTQLESDLDEKYENVAQLEAIIAKLRVDLAAAKQKPDG